MKKNISFVCVKRNNILGQSISHPPTHTSVPTGFPAVCRDDLCLTSRASNMNFFWL
jgi:hypothetical protein